MAWSTKMICDSVSEAGKRICTITASYPRFIHAEILTHRDRARNSASSRAIPFPKMSERIRTEPVIPIKWGMEQKGMQTGDEVPEHLAEHAKKLWLQGRNYMLGLADRLHNIERDYLEEHNGYAYSKEGNLIQVHKSIANRLLEPWMFIEVVMTATEWANFFRLRCHPDAEIHFQLIAGMIRECIAESAPRPVATNEWHLPFIQDDELEMYPIEVLRKASVARCARVSYLTHEGQRSIPRDLELFEKLVQGSGFGHWSPHEHVAKAMAEGRYRSGPFYGWLQFRKTFEQENQPGGI
jgi:hypothetical protein